MGLETKSTLCNAPEAIIFDCDGLLMDTESCWSIAEASIFERRGLYFGIEQKNALIGKSAHDAAFTLKNLLNETSSVKEIELELLESVEMALEGTCAPMPGAHQLLELIPESIKICVASNSPRRLLEHSIKKGGFSRKFEFLISSDEVPRPKPHPDIYLEAVQRLSKTSTSCIAFEDSATGCRSAVTAGLFVVGIPYMKADDIPAHTTFQSLDDPSLINIVQNWKNI